MRLQLCTVVLQQSVVSLLVACRCQLCPAFVALVHRNQEDTVASLRPHPAAYNAFWRRVPGQSAQDQPSGGAGELCSSGGGARLLWSDEPCSGAKPALCERLCEWALPLSIAVAVLPNGHLPLPLHHHHMGSTRPLLWWRLSDRLMSSTHKPHAPPAVTLVEDSAFTGCYADDGSDPALGVTQLLSSSVPDAEACAALARLQGARCVFNRHADCCT